MSRCNINIYNADCLQAMRDMRDNEFDLAIVDPPYGIGNWIPGNVPKTGKKASAPVEWNDDVPSDIYFKELRRISNKQIIWGANYYNCFSNNGSAIVWHKGEINPNFSQCEIASLSWGKKVDYVNINWQAGFYRERVEGEQIHPCQKPVKLYKWLLTNYAKEGDKILDTHLGSGSIAIACWDLKFDLTGYEIDKEYYDNAVERLERHKRQIHLF